MLNTLAKWTVLSGCLGASAHAQGPKKFAFVDTRVGAPGAHRSAP